MFSKLVCPPLLKTGTINEALIVIRDVLVNFYILKSDSGLICIDTGWRRFHVKKSFKNLNLDIGKVTDVFVTHLHWDHCRCLKIFPNARIFISKKENSSILHKLMKSGKPLHIVKNKMNIKRGNINLEPMETPGHTPGSVSYIVDINDNDMDKKAERFLFTGDTINLREGKVVTSILFNQDQNILEHSIHKLAEINGVTHLLTSHSGMSCNCEEAFSKWREDSENLRDCRK